MDGLYERPPVCPRAKLQGMKYFQMALFVTFPRCDSVIMRPA
jgi:hypothetical protein